MSELVASPLGSLSLLLLQIAGLWLLLFLPLCFIASKVYALWLANGFLLSGVMASLLLNLGFGLNLYHEAGFKELVVAQLIGLNLIVVPALYWLDKRKALSAAATRIPEGVLHAFAFLGGATGALVAQKAFRHKTIKTGFRTKTWIAFVFNIALPVGLFFIN